MNIKLEQIRDIIYSVFSDAGYDIKNFNVQLPQTLDIKIVKPDATNVTLTFTNNLPKVTWKKFIALSAKIVGITLGQNSGVLRLRYLPDIHFNYDSKTEQLFATSYDFNDIEQAIELEYGDEENKLLAKKCLHYASEWAKIASQGCDFSQADFATRKQLKKDCKSFVLENIKNDKELQCGSVILSFILLYVVLPVVLKFILERLFKKLFDS